MSRVFPREIHDSLPVAVEGDGVYIIDRDGKRYLDASGGAAVSCLGHSDPEVRRAIVEQAERLAYAHTSFFTTEPAEELADHLIARAPEGLARVYFVSGGSEAIETALKMARQYFLETGRPDRKHIIARRQSYHGNTLGALAVGGNAGRRAPYAPLLFPAHHIAPCFAYRELRQGETLAEYGRRAADELEAKILELGPENVAAFVAETVVGATLGAVPPAPGYFTRIREICDRHGVLLILDEVMSGTGRTGLLHACEAEGVSPDILVLAKGLGAGYQPIGATLASAKVFDAFAGGSGAFKHGHTYMGHPVACAAALAVQRTIEERDLLANVRRRGEQLMHGLAAQFKDHPHVGDIRGRGLFVGVELVRDRETKEPFESAQRLHAAIRSGAMAHGLICYPQGGTADGNNGDHVLLAPPFIVSEGDVARIIDLLATAIDHAIATMK